MAAKPIVAGTDGSEESLRAVGWAAREAALRGAPLRIVYGFNPVRQSVLIIGGDKTGDPRLYERIIPAAEKIWKQYLAERGWATGE